MFQLLQPTKAKIHKSDDKGIKLGQKDHKDGIVVNYTVTLPNTELDMFSPKLLPLLYGPGSPGEKGRKQADLDGVDALTSHPALTTEGERMGAVPWHEEQSGCTLNLDYGMGGDKSSLVLKEGTNKVKSVKLQEGGSIKVRCEFHAATDDLTDAQVGRLHRQHQREIKLTMVGPTIAQGEIGDSSDPGTAPPTPTTGGVVTPIQALASAEKAAANTDSAKKKA